MVLHKSWKAMMDQEQDTRPCPNYFVCRVVSYQSCIGCVLIHTIGTFCEASREFSVTRGCLQIYTPDIFSISKWHSDCHDRHNALQWTRAVSIGSFYASYEVVMSHLAGLWSTHCVWQWRKNLKLNCMASTALVQKPLLFLCFTELKWRNGVHVVPNKIQKL